MRLSARYGLFTLVVLTALSCSVFPTGSSPADEPIPAQVASPEFFQGVPIMPGAVSGHAIGSWYEYQIKATVLEVQEFYLREMPLTGWELWYQTGDANQGDNSIRLNYQKGEEQTAVFMNPAEGGFVQVLIS